MRCYSGRRKRPDFALRCWKRFCGFRRFDFLVFIAFEDVEQGEALEEAAHVLGFYVAAAFGLHLGVEGLLVQGPGVAFLLFPGDGDLVVQMDEIRRSGCALAVAVVKFGFVLNRVGARVHA